MKSQLSNSISPAQYEERLALQEEEIGRYQDRIASLVTDIDGYRRNYKGILASSEQAVVERDFLRGHAMPILRYPSEIEAALYPDGVEEGRRGDPSIFLVTQPKSGTVYISHTLQRTLAYEYRSTICGPRIFPELVIWPEVLADFSLGHMVAVSHMPATKFNLEVFSRYENKLVLHTRDPRAALLSMAIFIPHFPDDLVIWRPSARILV